MASPNRRYLALVFVLAQVAGSAVAQEHWVATWTASPQQARVTQLAPPAPSATPAPPAPGAQFREGFSNQTIRMIVRTSIGGRRLRVQLSNAFGTTPLSIGSARIAIREKDSAIIRTSDRPLAFNGKPSCIIPVGAMIISDPVDLEVPALSDLAVSIYVPSETGPPTMHNLGLHTAYVSKGELTAQSAIPDPAVSPSLYWLSSVDVLAPANAATLLTFGDSITDGARSTPEMNRSWPSVLAQRLIANRATANVAIANQGIGGNRVLLDIQGANALARFDRDVLAQAGVKWITLMEGINDIGYATRTDFPAGPPMSSAEDLIAGLRQMVERAHTHNIKVIGCTLLPYRGAAYYTEKGESFRQAVNRWIRSSGVFDAVLDFDSVTRDLMEPGKIRAEFDSGDHLHPNDAGYKAMADSIDLSLFAQPAVSTASRK